MFPQVGDVVGDYKVIGVIGSGGMGAVYRVEHVITKRIEAMKVLTSDLTSDPEQEQRFLREIQVQARLHHPNIAAVYNAFRAGRHFAMVMELVEGESLQSLLEREPIPRQTGIDCARQVLCALTYAHAEGVVHRDVTPANIIITAGGTAKLTDFGLAKTVTDLRLTRSGAPMGSVWYMSPEQVTDSSTIDARSDIYSVGAVLYEILTGRKLFDLDTAFAVMQAHVGVVPIPPSHRNREVPAAFDDIVLKALQKAPDARFQSADECRLALERVDPAGAPVPRQRTLSIDPLPIPNKPDSAEAAEPKPAVRRFSAFDAAIAGTLVMASMAAGIFAVGLFSRRVARLEAVQSRQQIVAPSTPPTAVAPDVSPASTVAALPAPDLPAPPEHSQAEHSTAQTSARPPHRASQPKTTPGIRVTGAVKPIENNSHPARLSAKQQPAPSAIEPAPDAAPDETDHRPAPGDLPDSPAPPVTSETAPAANPKKPGNRFLRFLGKIVPSRAKNGESGGSSKMRTTAKD